ncbi:hypothetical protein PC122_g21420 [Phytophthora cactorum]|nr:hypothetical protein PC122_g21420 [Phytophthora cactorum]
MEETSATSSSCIVGVSAPGVATAVICSKITEGSAARRRRNKGVLAPGVDTNSAARRRGVKSASTPGVDDAASSVGGCKRPTPEKLACSRGARLHDEAICNQAGLDCVRPRKESADGYDNGNPSKAGPGRGTSGAGLHREKRQRKQHKLRKSRSGTETLQEMSAGQTSDTTSSVETLNVLTRTRTGLQYRSMQLENPPTSASELTSLPAMSWMRFAKDLYDGCIEQICILSDLERMKSEAEELRQLHRSSRRDTREWLTEVLLVHLNVSLPAHSRAVNEHIVEVTRCEVARVRPDPEKVRVISEWPTLSNGTELRQFFGLATYLCNYVENYAGKIRPLSQLLKKEAEWKWTAECQRAFDAVKQGLTEAPILAVADQDRPFHVMCDASEFAIGCALMQHDHDPRGRVVYYQSRQLKPAERNYPVHDKELLAMKYALAKFRVYLLGSGPFVVYTDHASLRTAVKSPHISQQMASWLSSIAEYDFRVECKPGKLNVVADALSHRPDYAVKTADANWIGVERVSAPSSSLIDDVKAAHARDADAKQ